MGGFYINGQQHVFKFVNGVAIVFTTGNKASQLFQLLQSSLTRDLFAYQYPNAISDHCCKDAFLRDLP
jgi:hypothetical protein